MINIILLIIASCCLLMAAGVSFLGKKVNEEFKELRTALNKLEGIVEIIEKEN